MWKYVVYKMSEETCQTNVIWIRCNPMVYINNLLKRFDNDCFDRMVFRKKAQLEKGEQKCLN